MKLLKNQRLLLIQLEDSDHRVHYLIEDKLIRTSDPINGDLFISSKFNKHKKKFKTEFWELNSFQIYRNFLDSK
jgi:hypothetical protein